MLSSKPFGIYHKSSCMHVENTTRLSIHNIYSLVLYHSLSRKCVECMDGAAGICGFSCHIVRICCFVGLFIGSIIRAQKEAYSSVAMGEVFLGD